MFSYKNRGRQKAVDKYIKSQLFKLSLHYARQLTTNTHIYILSAYYGLLTLDQEIDDYNYTLKDKSNQIIKEWADKVKNQMKEKGINFNDESIFLCSTAYSKYLIKNFKNYHLPLDNLRIGKRLAFLRQITNKGGLL